MAGDAAHPHPDTIDLPGFGPHSRVRVIRASSSLPPRK